MRNLTPYFPGDPPAAELLGIFGALVIVPTLATAVAAFSMTSRYPRVRRVAMTALGIPALAGTLALGAFAVSVGARHFGEWAQLKSLIRRYSTRVAERAGPANYRLSPSQYHAIQSELLTPAPTFQFSGTHTAVRLRMMMTVWPYVGVDFGSGANAVFNPVTMICIYSD